LSHSSDKVFEDKKNHIFTNIAKGILLTGAGFNPSKVIAIMRNNASANTELVAKIYY
jgi:hypothetical protein